MLRHNELIDTLWNVNTTASANIKTINRINRYIMECKFVENIGKINPDLELIDTLWNVNTAVQISISGHSLELIDTLWNVNPLTTSLTVPSFSELIDTLWNVKDRT